MDAIDVDGGGADAGDAGIDSAPDALVDAPIADASEVACELAGDACSGRPDCCGPLVGYPFDLDQRCVSATKTPLGCPDPRTGACTIAAEPQCYQRVREDGGREVFRATGATTVPGLAACDMDLEREVLKAPPCP